MKNPIKPSSHFFLTILILLSICVSCSKLGQDVTPIKVLKPSKHITSRDGALDYDDWVGEVNSINEEYFATEDIMTLDFDYFWDKYTEVDENYENTNKSLLQAEMKRDFMSMEYVNLEDYLTASRLIQENGHAALLALKDAVLDSLGNNASIVSMHNFLKTTANDALEDESLNVVEKASVFLACVGIESSLDPELSWSPFGSPGSNTKVRDACNLNDISLDAIIIGAVAATTWNAINAVIAAAHHALDGTDKDGIINIVIATIGSIDITSLISLSSPALPFIAIGAVVGSIIYNCWEVIADFFDSIYDGLDNFFINLFGGGTDCDEPDGITASALDCSGDKVLFIAGLAGDDIVAYEWNNIHTNPQTIITQTRSFAFEPTNDNVTIKVTGICADHETVEQVVQPFDISDLIDEDPPTEVQFEDYPNPHESVTTSHPYQFWIYSGAGNNETLTWSGTTGTSIVQTGPFSATVTFYLTGTKTVTATITDNCNEQSSHDELTYTVN